jgi:hypothetical protein
VLVLEIAAQHLLVPAGVSLETWTGISQLV